MTKNTFIILVLFAISIRAYAQVPNNGFENWTSNGNYYNPVSWSCLNDKTAMLSKFTCERGTPGNPGNYYLKLTSKKITGLGVVPGIIVCGSLDQTTMKPFKGFPFNQRPVSLTGSWQHMIMGNSQGYVDIELTHWVDSLQKSIPIASVHYELSGMEMNWVNFTIPLTYVSGNIPDSCIIAFSASGSTPSDGDYLYLDNLAFSGSVAGIQTIAVNKKFLIYPNPASTYIMVDLSTLKKSKIDYQIYDVLGKILKSVNNFDVSKTLIIDISDFSKGNYMLKVKSEKDIFESRFVKE